MALVYTIHRRLHYNVLVVDIGSEDIADSGMVVL